MQNNSSKNYYYLLQVTQDASVEEIKRSYRRLAMKYHPDKNPGDMLAEKIFLDITEAYGTLSDAIKRKAHDYKTYAGKEYIKSQALSPDNIWRESLGLEKIVRKADPFRLNRDGLFFSLSALLTDERIYALQKENDNSLIESITENILYCCSFLHLKECVSICKRLVLISNNQPVLVSKIDIFLRQQKQKHHWEKYKIFFAIAAALALCLLVYFINK